MQKYKPTCLNTPITKITKITKMTPSWDSMCLTNKGVYMRGVSRCMT